MTGRPTGSPGAWRRSFLLGAGIVAIIGAVTAVDAWSRGAWQAWLTPALLFAGSSALVQAHHHQRAVLDLPPADGEESFRRRQALRRRHGRLESAWGAVALAAMVLAFVLPALLD
jgi:hypothetical protein